MTPREIELHIDELVLHGFAPGDRRRIGRAVERELSRLLTQAAASGALPRSLTTGSAAALRDAGAIQLTPGHSPESAGAQVAQAIYRGIAGPAAKGTTGGGRR